MIGAAVASSSPSECRSGPDQPPQRTTKTVLQAVVDPAADLTDLFAWMSPDGRLNLIANVFYAATFASEFSPAVQYAFHVESGAAYGAVGDEQIVLCQFYRADRIECWIGDEYVEGDPSDPAGISSASGRLRVFAGRRDDPFFIEYEGFMATVEQVIAACPLSRLQRRGMSHPRERDAERARRSAPERP